MSMTMIAYAGVANTTALEALRINKGGEIEKALELLMECDRIFALVGHTHLDIVAIEAKGEKLNLPLLFVHAEDQIMTIETLIILIREIIYLYNK